MNWALEVIFGNTEGTLLLRGGFVLSLAFIVLFLFKSGRASNPNKNGGLVTEITEAENELFIQSMFNESNEDNDTRNASKTNKSPKKANGKKNQKKVK